MKKAILILAAAFILCGAEISQAQNNDPSKASVTVGVNNKGKKIFDSSLVVKVLMVVEDSRCPEGTTCVQAGNAKLRLQIRKGSEPSEIIELDTNGKNTASAAGYEITLDNLTPTPKSGAPVNKKDYAATLTIQAGATTAKN
jgi:hypothetical protein